MHTMLRFSGTMIAGIVAGLIAGHSFDFLRTSSSAEYAPLNAENVAHSAATDAVRSRKGDRLSVAHPPNTEVARLLGSVEFTEGTVIDRNSSGRLVFRNDSVTNTLIVLKNAVAPKSTVHVGGGGLNPNVSGTGRAMPLPARLVGCEALSSVLADKMLARLVGRCFT